MDPRRAATVMGCAGALGLAAQVLFYAVPLGINLVLMIVAIIITSWFTRPANARFDSLDAWLPAGTIALAASVAFRADPVLVMLDTLGAVTLTGATVAAVNGVRVSRRSASHVVLLMGDLIAATIAAGFPVLASVNGRYRLGGRLRHADGSVAGVIRGLVISAPVLLVFALLFAAADAVFARSVGDLLTVGIDFGELAGRTTFAAVAAWLCAGLLGSVAVGTFVTAVPASDSGSTNGDGEGSGRWRLGTLEALMVLGGVIGLFAWFVGIQATYLFGGRDTLDASGITYSDYARRGFFELVAVAVLAGLLIVVTDALVARRTRSQLIASQAICALTAVVLASALMRLMLYQQAYGWTELRFYVLAAIVWLGLGILATAVALFMRRTGWLPHALAGAALAVTVAVNIVGPQSFIASQNVARALDASLVPPDGQTGLDEIYLSDLGYDAVPVVVEALDRLPAGDRDSLRVSLALRLWQLDRDEGSAGWQAWNLARERAREALEGRRDELPVVEEKPGDPSLRYNP